MLPDKTPAKVKAKTKPAKIKINENEFPSDPNFLTSNATFKAQNEKIVADLKAAAKKGDLDAIKKMKVPPSQKLLDYRDALAANVNKQLNPPPPPKQLKVGYNKIHQKIKSFKEQGGDKAGLKKVGFWAVLGEPGGIPQGTPTKGDWMMKSYNKTTKSRKIMKEGEEKWKKVIHCQG